MHIDISACGDAPRWVYSNENVSGQFHIILMTLLLNSKTLINTILDHAFLVI